MKKKTYFLFIILIIIGFSVYFFDLTGMLDDEDKTRDEPLQNEKTNEAEESQSHNQNDHTNNEAEEVSTITDKMKLVIVDSIKNTFDYFFDEEVRIVAIGDSLTKGVGDQTDRGGYVGVLDRTINQNDSIAHFDNHGKSGIRTEQLIKRLDNEDIIDSIEQADIILLTIGGNDVMHVLQKNFADLQVDQFEKEQEHYEDRLQQILEKIQQRNSKAHIFLLGLYNPFGEYFQDVEELDHIVDDWDEGGKLLTDQYENITFIPIKDIFSNNEEEVLSDDHFHPNELGYDRMADRVLDYFKNKERWNQ